MIKIGLEIHCQLTNLQSKLFCSCKANYRKYPPNHNVCPICMGLPGTLPRLNQKAIEKAIMIAMALNCDIPDKLAFFRKNYFYPDLPKNFQITQLNIYGNTSIGTNGFINIEDSKIRIRRIQLEEDPGKLIYEGLAEKITMVDYNRAGTPLVEIVTEPDFENPRQVRQFLNILSDLLENLDVSDPGLEGAMRADGNVSINNGKKVEIKNINSFHDLEKALRFEITRQTSLTSRGIEILQETRHWDERRKITVSARSKEEELDYRYFLEGDIPWIKIPSQFVEELRSKMPESISSKKERYITKFGITRQVAEILSSDKFYSDLFEEAYEEDIAKDIANIITTDLMGLVDTKEKRTSSKIEGSHIRDLARAIKLNKITRTASKLALQEMVKSGKTLSQIIDDLDLSNLSDESKLKDVVESVLQQESKAFSEAATNPQVINYLVGKVMQKTKGKADPKITLDLITEKIKSRT